MKHMLPDLPPDASTQPRPDGHRWQAAVRPNYGESTSEDRVERRQSLRKVRRMALRMAQAAMEHALGPEPDPNRLDPDRAETAAPIPIPAEAALKFTRFANVVRTTVELEEKLDAQAWQREHGTPGGGRRRTVKNRRKELLRQIVERSIQEDAPPRDLHRMMTELQERLDDPGLEDRLASEEKMADIAKHLCGDLGIEAYLRAFTDEQLDYNITVDRSHWSGLPKLAPGIVGMPGVPSAYELEERAAGRPWPPKLY